MPENTVKVDRSTKWGNPFTVDAALQAGYNDTDAELRGMCADAFRRWLDGIYEPIEPERRAYILSHIDQLRGHDLACWCPFDQPCHADVLLELANSAREIALRITNFVAGMDIRRAVAVYALAMQMSLRGLDDGLQRAAMRSICEACLKGWAANRGEPEPRPCGECKGAGTVGITLEDYRTCPVCAGTGAAR
jgi:hypothetical protein